MMMIRQKSARRGQSDDYVQANEDRDDDDDEAN